MSKFFSLVVYHYPTDDENIYVKTTLISTKTSRRSSRGNFIHGKFAEYFEPNKLFNSHNRLRNQVYDELNFLVRP